MRPFKFFFGISVGIIVFFFLARVFFAALILAAVMSIIFFLFRKVKNFFKYMTWRDYDYGYGYDWRDDFPSRPQLPRYQFDDGLLVDSWEGREPSWMKERIIEVK